MSPGEPERFEQGFTVAEADIDALGHVNNVVYLKWVQEVATSHWRHAATPEQHQAIVWVALRHEIDYEAPAFASEEVVARTWVEGWTGATSERHTEILRPADGKLLARAVTVWCAVDTTSRRPRRVDVGLRERFIAR